MKYSNLKFLQRGSHLTLCSLIKKLNPKRIKIIQIFKKNISDKNYNKY